MSKKKSDCLPYSNWSSLRCMALTHRHPGHSPRNVRAIGAWWGCTRLLPPRSPLCGPAAPLRLQTPGGSFPGGEDEEVPCLRSTGRARNHRCCHPPSFASGRSSAPRFCWLTSSKPICRVEMLQVYLEMTHGSAQTSSIPISLDKESLPHHRSG